MLRRITPRIASARTRGAALEVDPDIGAALFEQQ